MKKQLFIFGAVLAMAGCSGSVETIEEEVPAVEETGPTQEELNSQLKEEAVEISFVEANGGDLAAGTKVKATGEASGVMDGGQVDFLLSTQEGEGYGSYRARGFITNDGGSVEEGQTVTIYGTYTGKDESGLPEINFVIVEPAE